MANTTRQKYGGRKRGTPNKGVNTDLKNAIEKVSFKAIESILNDFDSLTTSDKIKLLTTSLRHILPTLQSVDSKVDVVGALGTQISEMEESEVIEIARLIHKRLN